MSLSPSLLLLEEHENDRSHMPYLLHSLRNIYSSKRTPLESDKNLDRSRDMIWYSCRRGKFQLGICVYLPTHNIIRLVRYNKLLPRPNGQQAPASLLTGLTLRRSRSSPSHPAFHNNNCVSLGCFLIYGFSNSLLSLTACTRQNCYSALLHPCIE